MGLNIITPKFGAGESLPNWMERGLRNGNFLHELLRREKVKTQRRLVQVAQPFRNHQQNNKSEFELMSVMDGRTFMRWWGTDPGIIQEPKEFAKLVKDNPVMQPWKV